MKKLIALTLSLLLLAGCTPAVYEGPTETAWVMTESCTTQYDTFTGESSTHRRTNSYDSFGNPVHTCFYSDDELTSEHKRTYDEQGNCIGEVTWEHFWVFSYPISRTGYTYDEKGRLLTTTYRNGFGIKTGGDTYTYDDEANTITWDGTYDTQTQYLNENGDPIRIVTRSEASGIETETIYEYDELGRSTKITDYYDGALSATFEVLYDDQDRALARTLWDADGQILSRTTYVYEENTITTVDMDGYKGVQTLRPDGQVEKQENYTPAGELLSRTDYVYTEIRVPAKEE